MNMIFLFDSNKNITYKHFFSNISENKNGKNKHA